MHHPNLEPRMSSGPLPWERLDRSSALSDEEPPTPAELAEDVRLRPRTTTDVVIAEDFLRGHGSREVSP